MALVDQGLPTSRDSRAKGAKRKKRDAQGRMSLRGHLRELRRRLVVSAAGVVLGAVAGFFLYDWLVANLAAPVLRHNSEENAQLTSIAFNAVGQPLDLLIRLSLFVGFVISSPLWLYQTWGFIMPGLRKKEKRYAVAFIAVSVPLFLAGIVLAHTLLPRAIDFFFSLNPDGTANIIAPDIYFTFVLHLFLACGIAMVIPVVLVGINLMGILTGRQILKAWRGVVFMIALMSALAAPGGEAVTMFFIMVPLTLLFAAAIGICLLNDRRKAQRKSV